MPYMWAKNSRLYKEYSLDMFYPTFQLFKKESLGIVWLAANYDPEKYRKIIPTRDCERTDIFKTCQSIMNPAERFALRLSAQLLLGTVRIYRTKTKLALEHAEQMMLKLSTLLREASIKSNLNMPISVLRSEAITNDIGFGIVDYSLEPAYYDPDIIMHLNEEDFFRIGGSPIKTPVKVKHVKDGKHQNSPLQVSNRSISINEDLPSPHRPILIIPGEAEFTNGDEFGPAPSNYLAYLERANNVELQSEYTERSTGGEELMNTLVEEVEEELLLTSTANRQQQQPPPVHVNDDALKEEPLKADRLLRASRNLTLMFSQENVHDSKDIVTCLTNLDDDAPIDFQVDNTAVNTQQNWQFSLKTPADAVILKPQPKQPGRKRKLQVDHNIILKSEEIKTNISTPESLRRIPIIAGTALTSAKLLFEKPLFSDFSKFPKVRALWINNAKLHRGNEMQNLPIFPGIDKTVIDEEERQFQLRRSASLEIMRHHDETPGSIDNRRVGSASLHSIEATGGSTILVHQTPVEEDFTRSLGNILEGSDFDPPLHLGSSPRLSGIGELPQEFSLDTDQLHVELDPIPESISSLVDDVSYVTTEDLEYNVKMTNQSVKHKRHLLQTLKLRGDVTFNDLFPYHLTMKRDAALAFYAALDLNKNQLIKMQQTEIFGAIHLDVFLPQL